MNILPLEEVNFLATTVDKNKYRNFVENLAQAMNLDRSIVGLGAGRMGYSLRAFIMRLCHMGYNASMIGDTNVPRIYENDVVVINTSSGETPTMILYARQAREAGAKIFTITTNPHSTIALLSDHVLSYGESFKTKQVMKTAYEQFSYLLFDSIVIELIQLNNIDVDFMSHNHSILE